MHWSVSIEQAADNSGNNNIRLGLKDGQSGEVVWVTEEYASLEDWKQEVLRLKEELDSALEQGMRDWVNKKEVETEAQEAGGNPEKIWEQMQEFEDEQELSSFFNQLGEEERKRTADYILTQVNMFKGNAPYFAQNYDSKSNKLA